MFYCHWHQPLMFYLPPQFSNYGTNDIKSELWLHGSCSKLIQEGEYREIFYEDELQGPAPCYHILVCLESHRHHIKVSI